MKRMIAACAVLLAAVVFLPFFAGAQELVWDTDRIIDGNIGTANYEPGLVMQGSNAVAVWRSSQGGLNRIVSCYSSDYGVIWSTEQTIDDGTNTNDKPIVAMDETNVVAMFKHFTGDGYRYYADYSTNNGVTWNNDSVVSDATLSQDDLVTVISGNNVVALWKQYDGEGAWNMYCDYSADGGATWHTDLELEQYDTYAERPDVVICGNFVIVVWRQRYDDINRIASAYSSDAGATWSTAQLIDNDPGNHADTPKLAIADDRVIAVWNQFDETSSRIYSCYSDDWGLSWSTPVTIDNNPGNNNYDPQIAADGNRAVVVWRGLSGKYHGYATATSDNGETWTVPVQLDDNPYNINGPLKVEMCCKKVVAVWVQENASGKYHIYSNYSTDGGATWDENVMIEDNTGFGVDSQFGLAMACGNAAAVWRQSDGGKDRIYSNYGNFLNVGSSGSVPVGPLAAGISALLVWRKRRKQV